MSNKKKRHVKCTTIFYAESRKKFKESKNLFCARLNQRSSVNCEAYIQHAKIKSCQFY